MIADRILWRIVTSLHYICLQLVLGWLAFNSSCSTLIGEVDYVLIPFHKEATLGKRWYSAAEQDFDADKAEGAFQFEIMTLYSLAADDRLVFTIDTSMQKALLSSTNKLQVPNGIAYR